MRTHFAQKLARWTQFQPRTPEESKWKRSALKQFRAEVKAAR